MNVKKRFRTQALQLHPRGRITGDLNSDGEVSISLQAFLPYGEKNLDIDGEATLSIFISEHENERDERINWPYKAKQEFRKKGMEPIGVLSVDSGPHGPAVFLVRSREYMRDLLRVHPHVLYLMYPVARAARIEKRTEKYSQTVIPVLDFSVNFMGPEAIPMELSKT